MRLYLPEKVQCNINLSIFRTHAQEGYRKVLEMNSTSILYSLAF